MAEQSFFSEWARGHIACFDDVLNTHGIMLTLHESVNKIGNSPNRLLPYNASTAVQNFLFRQDDIAANAMTFECL